MRRDERSAPSWRGGRDGPEPMLKSSARFDAKIVDEIDDPAQRSGHLRVPDLRRC